MAKRKVVELEPELESWEAVDAALRDIAISKSKIEKLTAAYNESEQKRRAEALKDIPELENTIQARERQIERFAAINRADFDAGKKSKALTHGVVAYRTSPPKVATIKGFTLASSLNMILKSAYSALFVRTKEEINKEAIITQYSLTQNSVKDPAALAPEIPVDDTALADLGLKIEQDETFGYELRLAAEA